MTTTTTDVATATTFSGLHPDIIESHVLPRLDGPSLASTACCSATLRRLSNHHHLWSELCHSTWPSTATSPLLRRLISAEPHRFFSLASSITVPSSSSSSSSSPPPWESISAVDISYKNSLIFSKVQETETETSWFKCSPFRIDMVDPKDVIPTNIELPTSNNGLETFGKHMTLSWLLVELEPRGHRVISLSSQEPVSVQRHWLTGEVQLKYAVILGHVQCGVVVTCGGGNGAANNVVMVKEVSLEMEDMDGKHLNGSDSLEILHRAWKGKTIKGGRNRAEVCKKMYEDYLEKRREKRERKLRTEGVLDMLCVAFLLSAFVSCVGIVLWRR